MQYLDSISTTHINNAPPLMPSAKGKPIISLIARQRAKKYMRRLRRGASESFFDGQKTFAVQASSSEATRDQKT
jgi:hypothetical protein